LPVPLWHVTQIAFITSLILDFISWLWTVDKDRARLFRLVLIINGAPVVSYGLLTYGMAPLLVDTHGRRLVMIRYVHWLFTTPAMVFLYSKVSSITNAELMFAMAMEFVCIVTGFLASAMHFPFDLINLVISCITFYFVMSALNKMLAIAIRFAEHLAFTRPPRPSTPSSSDSAIRRLLRRQGEPAKRHFLPAGAGRGPHLHDGHMVNTPRTPTPSPPAIARKGRAVPPLHRAAIGPGCNGPDGPGPGSGWAAGVRGVYYSVRWRVG
jgi:hypothetical protein